MNAPVRTPVQYERKNELAHRQYIEAELADTYRKSADVILPYGFRLGFVGATGQEVNFGLDASNVFSITVDGVTIISFTTSADFSALETEIVAARDGEVSLLAKISSVETVAVDAESAAATAQSEITAARDGEVSLLAKITTMDSATVDAATAAATAQSEITAARDGETSLIAKITTMDSATASAASAAATAQSEITAARDGEVSLLAKISSVETTAVDAETAAATAQSEITAARDGEVSLTAKISTVEQAIVDGDDAVAATVTTLSATVNAKNQTFIQTSAPTAIAAGDLWIDSDDNNRLYRATAPGSGSWVAIPYTDTGKVTTFAQTGAPTATAMGDLWIDTDDDNKVYRATAPGSGSWVAVDDARIAITATALATVQGYLSASYTIELDVNGRATLFRLQDDGSTSGIIFKADAFDFYDGITDRPLFSATAGRFVVNGDLQVASSISIGAARLKVALESIRRTGADGDAVQWAGGTSIGAVPEYVLDLSNLAPLATGEQYSVALTGVTNTGATVYAKINTPGTTTPVTDTTDASGGGGDPDRVMAKSDSADAYDNIYQFRIQGLITVTSTYSPDLLAYVNDGYVEVSTWFDDGGGWEEGPSIGLYPWDAGVDYNSLTDISGSYAYDITFPVSWTNPIGAGGTYGFGASHESGGSLSDLTSVSWIKQTSSGTRTASPSGEAVKITAFPRNQ